MASPICFRLFEHFARLAASRTFWTAGSSRPIRMAMMAMTTSNSTRVKALRRYQPKSVLLRVMMRIPSGQTTALFPLFPRLWSRHLRLRRRLPDLHGPVQAGRGDPLAVRAEGHRLDPACVAAQDLGLRAGPVPDGDGAIGPAPGEARAVAVERHALAAGRRGRGGEGPPLGGVPDLDRPVPAGRGQPRAVSAEFHAGDAARMRGPQGEQLLAGPPVPDAEGVVPTADGQVPAVG